MILWSSFPLFMVDEALTPLPQHLLCWGRLWVSRCPQLEDDLLACHLELLITEAEYDRHSETIVGVV